MTYFSMAIRTSFTEDDWKLVQLVLTLFRNVLAIQEITLPQKASGEATQLLYLADSFLELMFKENMMDLILVLAQHIDESSGYLKHENLLLLEIFHYLFLSRDPELIAKVRPEGSKVYLFFRTNLSISLDDPFPVTYNENCVTLLMFHRSRSMEILIHQLIH